MQTVIIKLTSINDIKIFIEQSNAQSFDIDLCSGRYLIDAKSIMGIFSLDLSKSITVEMHAKAEECQSFLDGIKQFTV